ncbi:MAG TPA: hypothetical protein PKB14_06530 [Rubrivivax sp.]|nr:hypothetical protein [Rubrivivax sp.]
MLMLPEGSSARILRQAADGRRLLQGAQPVEVYEQALRSVAAQAAA